MSKKPKDTVGRIDCFWLKFQVDTKPYDRELYEEFSRIIDTRNDPFLWPDGRWCLARYATEDGGWNICAWNTNNCYFGPMGIEFRFPKDWRKWIIRLIELRAYDWAKKDLVKRLSSDASRLDRCRLSIR